MRTLRSRTASTALLRRPWPGEQRLGSAATQMWSGRRLITDHRRCPGTGFGRTGSLTSITVLNAGKPRTCSPSSATRSTSRGTLLWERYHSSQWPPPRPSPPRLFRAASVWWRSEAFVFGAAAEPRTERRMADVSWRIAWVLPVSRAREDLDAMKRRDVGAESEEEFEPSDEQRVRRMLPLSRSP